MIVDDVKLNVNEGWLKIESVLRDKLSLSGERIHSPWGQGTKPRFNTWPDLIGLSDSERRFRPSRSVSVPSERLRMLFSGYFDYSKASSTN